MMFHFRLAPIEDIMPWGPKEAPSLSWFGLTDGWFWIEIGDQELFRYSQEASDYWQKKYPDFSVPRLPYDDYQVVRYWEDLLGMLPTILDPIPNDLALRVSDAQGWLKWEIETLAWLESRVDDENVEDARDLYDSAMLWWNERHWDAWHLAHPPNIWLWRVEDTVHVRWNNQDVKIEGIPVWEAQQGEVTLPVSEFMASVESFHDRFLSEMGKRVDEAVAAWPRPDVKVDFPHLLKEQEERREWLNYALAPRPRERLSAFSWDEIRAAMVTITQELTAVSSKDVD